MRLVHTRSDEDVLLDHLAPRNTDLDLETRNFRQYCQAVSNCATSTGYHRLEGCLEALSGAMTAVARSRDAARSLWNVLNDTPIVTSCAGSFIGGVLAAKAVESPGKNDPAECSTSRSNKDADVLLSAMTAGLAHDSGASSVSIEVVGESSHYIITITSSDKSSQARHPTCKN